MVMTDATQRTPLYDFHERHGARFVPFAGWDMPVQYAGIIEEHNAVRQAAGLFDVSHMGEVWVEGPDTGKFLDFMMTNQFSNLKPGRARYTLMCYLNGGVVDDVIGYCFAEDKFLFCLNAANAEKDMQ